MILNLETILFTLCMAIAITRIILVVHGYRVGTLVVTKYMFDSCGKDEQKAQEVGTRRGLTIDDV